MISEVTTDFERRLATSLRAYADGANLSMPANRVVAGVLSLRRRRPPWLIPAVVAAVVFVAAVGTGGVYLLTQAGMASSPATAQVSGQTYTIWLTRNMEIEASDLQFFGEVSSPIADEFAGTAAFELNGVDPRIALVVRLKPGQGDGGRDGDWALLIRGALTPELCTYLATSDNPPSECLLTSS